MVRRQTMNTLIGFVPSVMIRVFNFIIMRFFFIIYIFVFIRSKAQVSLQTF